jgi:hypothetical protein
LKLTGKDSDERWDGGAGLVMIDDSSDDANEGRILTFLFYFVGREMASRAMQVIL